MARIRSLHPGQWTDEDFVSCGPYARLLALALRNEADDNGVFEWKPVGLKMRLFPVDNIDIVELLAELVTFNQIARFEHNGKAYGVIRNFARYQRPKRPKPVHHMPDQFRTYIGLDAPCSELDEDEDTPIPTLGEMPPFQTTSVPTMGELDPVQVTSVPPMSEIVPQMKEEGGRRYKKEEDFTAVLSAREPSEITDWPDPPETITVLTERAGLSSAQWQLLTASELLKWRNNGLSFELDVVPTITAMTERQSGRSPPRTWAYFTPAITQNHANRLETLKIPEADRHDRTSRPAKPEGRSTAYLAAAVKNLAEQGFAGAG
ncbi:MAG: hypothetical protein QM645_14080 [Asticcacaulis sp.]